MNDTVRRVCVIGLGYIGLPTAAVLAGAGLDVLGVDISPTLVAAVNSGTVVATEPGLGELVNRLVAEGRLAASDRVAPADAFIIAVPTPIRADKTADLSLVLAAAGTLAPHLNPGNLVVLESTSPPGTTLAVAHEILRHRPDLREPGGSAAVLFAHAPERVLPGTALREITGNDRVLGGTTAEAGEAARELYARFVTGELIVTDATTAELVKLAENSFRDVNLAFANELAEISDELGVDAREVIRLANHHPRVAIMSPGPGVGGHCIPVDPWFIVESAPQSARLIRAARQVNDERPGRVLDRINGALERRPEAGVVLLLGLAFKPDIDDLRTSPALEIARELVSDHPEHRFLVSEPHISRLPDELDQLHNSALVADVDSAVHEAQAVVVLVDHSVYRAIDPASLEGKLVIDTRGLWPGVPTADEGLVPPSAEVAVH